MRLGIGLPASIPGVQGGLLLDWARRADAGPFSSLGTIGRLVYPNYDSLIALAAAAGATGRIRLMTTVLLAPLHNTALLAKQTASLDALSGGRLTLGLAVGSREDDYRAAGRDFHTRGRRFEQQLGELRRIWAGEPVSADVGPIGPLPMQPGGPEILVGGYTPKAIERAARLAAGFIAGGAPPQRALQSYQIVEVAWQAAGRVGKPRFVTAAYYGLGDNAREKAAVYIRGYYGLGTPVAEGIVNGMPASPEAVKATIQAFSDIGADELILWPCIPEIDQVDRLAEIVA